MLFRKTYHPITNVIVINKNKKVIIILVRTYEHFNLCVVTYNRIELMLQLSRVTGALYTFYFQFSIKISQISFYVACFKKNVIA